MSVADCESFEEAEQSAYHVNYVLYFLILEGKDPGRRIPANMKGEEYGSY